MITPARGHAVLRDGSKSASETTNPFDSDASDVTRAIQFMKPVSNPMKSPNAVFA